MTTTTVRCLNPRKLETLASAMRERGYSVGPVCVPENPYVDGLAYVIIGASIRAVFDVQREIGYAQIPTFD